MTELATAVPKEVSSSLSLDTVVTLAIISAICSAVALILNTIIPLITQHFANKHALQMAKIEQWDKVKFEAYQNLVSGTKILTSSNIPSGSTIINACVGISKILPYLEGEELNEAIQILFDFDRIETDPMVSLSIKGKYIKLLNEIAKKFEEPSVSRKKSKTEKLSKKSKEEISEPQSKQKKQLTDQ